MAGFMLWIPKAWSAWATATGEQRGIGWSDEQHERFDRWLAEGNANSVRVDNLGEPP